MFVQSVTSGPVLDALYDEVLAPSFPPGELCTPTELHESAAVEDTVWVALDETGRVLGGAVGEWSPDQRVMLLAWLAVRPGLRAGGVGGALLDAALAAWRSRYGPCLVLAEVEDPAWHSGSDLTGDPKARLRFYQRRGAYPLDLPYFQPGLNGQQRVPHLLLMVLHVDPQLRGRRPGTVDARTLREYLQDAQRTCEGAVGTDPQSQALWQALEHDVRVISLPDSSAYWPAGQPTGE